MADEILHGFPVAEFAMRLERAQAGMAAQALDALVVTTPQNVRYFTGFATTFWESPTRPWFIVVPRTGRPIAVIPEIGAAGMAMTWVDDIRTWPAPQPDDDGLSLLSSALKDLPRTSGRIGWEMGRESVIRMPIADFDRLRDAAQPLEFVDGSPLIWDLRMVKSEGEIDRIRRACTIASDAFDELMGALAAGLSDHEIARMFRVMLGQHGADTVPFLAVCAGAGGYSQIIVGPAGVTVQPGHVLFIDVGATFDGYFCDFDRNFSFGAPDDALKKAHETLWQATEAGMAAARPGATTDDIFNAMAGMIEDAGYAPPAVGRLGHGLGMHLTEPPSHKIGDGTTISAGMVLTIEPGLSYAPGKELVHEENIVVREDGVELLTRRAPREMVVINR